MRISDKGISQLLKFEGLVVSPYLDSKGIWTYGVGHTAAAGEPIPEAMPRGPVSRDMMDTAMRFALKVFRRDLADYGAEVSRSFTRQLSQEQYDAALLFHFHTGAIGRATWVKQWNAGEDAKARKSFMNWRKPASILPRRKEERDLFFGGQYSLGAVAIYDADAKGRKKHIGVQPFRELIDKMQVGAPVYGNTMPLDETAPKEHPYPEEDSPPLPPFKPAAEIPPTRSTREPDRTGAPPVSSPAGRRTGLVALIGAAGVAVSAWLLGMTCSWPWLAEFLGVGCGG